MGIHPPPNCPQDKEGHDTEQTDESHAERHQSRPHHPPQNPTPDPPNPSSAAQGDALAAEQGQQGMTDWEIIKQLGGYVWPKDNPEYRWRVVGASVLLVGAKALNVTVSSLGFRSHSS